MNRRRNMLATVLGLALALVALLGALAPAARALDWSTFGFDVQRTGANPFEHELTAARAPTLTQRWQTNLGAVIDTQPVYAAGVRLPGGHRHDLVYAGSEHGELAAMDAHSGRILWARRLAAQHTRCEDVPHGDYGVTGAPVLDRRTNRLYVAAADDRVYALDLSTGRRIRGWPVTVTTARADEHVWGAPTLFHDRLYVGTASYCDLTPFHGRLVAIDTRRAQRTADWLVTRGHGPGGGIWGWGGAAVDPRDGDVYVATGNGESHSERLPYAERVVRLSPGLHVKDSNHPAVAEPGDADFGAFTPLFGAHGCPPQLVAVHKTGVLFLYDRHALGRGPVQRIRLGDPKPLSSFGTYAWSDSQRTLYVTVGAGATTAFRHGIMALRLTSACRLAVRWTHELGPADAVPSPPIVAGDVVYYDDGGGGEALALDARSGSLLWRSGGALGPAYAAPTVIDGWLYVPSWDHRLHAFAPAGVR